MNKYKILFKYKSGRKTMKYIKAKSESDALNIFNALYKNFDVEVYSIIKM